MLYLKRKFKEDRVGFILGCTLVYLLAIALLLVTSAAVVTVVYTMEEIGK